MGFTPIVDCCYGFRLARIAKLVWEGTQKMFLREIHWTIPSAGKTPSEPISLSGLTHGIHALDSSYPALLEGLAATVRQALRGCNRTPSTFRQGKHTHLGPPDSHWLSDLALADASVEAFEPPYRFLVQLADPIPNNPAASRWHVREVDRTWELQTSSRLANWRRLPDSPLKLLYERSPDQSPWQQLDQVAQELGLVVAMPQPSRQVFGRWKEEMTQLARQLQEPTPPRDLAWWRNEYDLAVLDYRRLREQMALRRRDRQNTEPSWEQQIDLQRSRIIQLQRLLEASCESLEHSLEFRARAATPALRANSTRTPPSVHHASKTGSTGPESRFERIFHFGDFHIPVRSVPRVFSTTTDGFAMPPSVQLEVEALEERSGKLRSDLEAAKQKLSELLEQRDLAILTESSQWNQQLATARHRMHLASRQIADWNARRFQERRLLRLQAMQSPDVPSAPCHHTLREKAEEWMERWKVRDRVNCYAERQPSPSRWELWACQLALLEYLLEHGTKLPWVVDLLDRSIQPAEATTLIDSLDQLACRGIQVLIIGCQLPSANASPSQALRRWRWNDRQNGWVVERSGSTSQSAISALPEDRLVSESDLTELQRLPEEVVTRLRSLGIWTLGELTSLSEAKWQRVDRAVGRQSALVRTVATEALLQLQAPGMRGFDAALLVAAGVPSMEALHRQSRSQLQSDIQRLLQTTVGQSIWRRGSHAGKERLHNWLLSARPKATHPQQPHPAPAASPPRTKPASAAFLQAPSESPTLVRERPSMVQSSVTPPAVSQDPDVLPFPAVAKSTDRAHPKPMKENTPSQTWNTTQPLLAHQPVVDAPSIGPKMAGLFEAHGIVTVADLLKNSAAEIARRIANEQCPVPMIRRWQQQAAIACMIPGLRSVDAQLIVAAGYEEIERIAEVGSERFRESIERYAKSSKGYRILRGSAAPVSSAIERWHETASRLRDRKVA
jgi:predicted flap endonuclease-1-like 5' DNA nuclease